MSFESYIILWSCAYVRFERGDAAKLSGTKI